MVKKGESPIEIIGHQFNCHEGNIFHQITQSNYMGLDLVVRYMIDKKHMIGHERTVGRMSHDIQTVTVMAVLPFNLYLLVGLSISHN